MSRPRQRAVNTTAPEQVLLRTVQIFSCALVGVFALGSWWYSGTTLALSVLFGGLLVNGSFVLLQGDIKQILHRVGAAGEQMARVKRMEKIRFLVKFYARLIVLALLLAVLVNWVELNMIGVALGLATVMLSVFVVVLVRGKSIYQERLHGA
ncbi:MAG: hypothetical protein CSA34_05390 [Desulfobulbus propionicus]|nr:MAG: hypothetical protein CSA34_05390 [Desulfobulbus propionicus]